MNEIIAVSATIAAIIVSTTYTMHLMLGFPPKGGWYGVGIILIVVGHGLGGTVLIHAIDYLLSDQLSMYANITIISSFVLFALLSTIVCLVYVLVRYLKSSLDDQ